MPKRRPRRPVPTSLADRLVACLRTRPTARGDTYELDLRSREWARDPARGEKRILTVRCPSDPGWPDAGRTTRERALAEGWVRDHYAPMLDMARRVAENGAKATLTVEVACEEYVRYLEKTKGVKHNTTVGRRSACRVHLVPLWGNRLLATLRRSEVRTAIEGLQVCKREAGRVLHGPAGLRTRRNVREALRAVWAHAFPDQDPDWAGIRILDPSAGPKRQLAARRGYIEEILAARSYEREQVVRILTAATWYDRHVLARPNLRGSNLPGTPAVIAVLLGTAARISEGVLLRWSHIDWSAGAVLIPGYKSAAAVRWIPLQESLLPWLRMLRDQHAGADSREFVLRVRRASAGSSASVKTVQGRIARATELAGEKQRGKLTHILRATHLSWAATQLEAEMIRRIAGHSEAFKGATDDYVSMVPHFPSRYRTYLDIPTPEEIEARVATFSPV